MAHRRRDLEKQLGNVNGVISKAVDALLGDNPSRALRKRLTALETERDEVEPPTFCSTERLSRPGLVGTPQR
jgi:hypothetical protein